MSAADIIGFVQFAACLLKKCYDYGCAVKSAPAEAKALTDSLASLYRTCADLNLLKAHIVNATVNGQSVASDFPSDLSACMKEARELEALLDAKAPSSFTNRARFPFRSKELDNSRNAIDASFTKLHQYVQRATLVSSNVGLAKLQQSVDNQALLQFLSKLSNYDYARPHDNLVGKRYAQTCEWVLDTPEYKDWTAVPSSTTLWLHGPSGAGKSVLTAMVAQKLLDMSHGSDAIVLRYYFSSSDAATTTLDSLLGSMARQLCARSPRLPLNALAQLLPESFRGPAVDPAELRNALPILLSLVSTKVYFVIDAINECNDPKRIAACLLDLACSNSRSETRVFMSSTSTPHSQLTIDHNPRVLVLQRNSHQLVDIENYIDHRLDGNHSATKLESSKLQSIRRQLIKNAGQMFRYAKCIMDELEHLTSDELTLEINKLPSSDDENDNLSQLYTLALSRQMDGSKHVREGNITALLLFLLYMRVPLTLTQLSACMQMAPCVREPSAQTMKRLQLQESVMRDIAQLVDDLQIFVEFDHTVQVVQFVHESAKDYLQKSHHYARIFHLYGTDGQEIDSNLRATFLLYVERILSADLWEGIDLPAFSIRDLFSSAATTHVHRRKRHGGLRHALRVELLKYGALHCAVVKIPHIMAFDDHLGRSVKARVLLNEEMQTKLALVINACRPTRRLLTYYWIFWGRVLQSFDVRAQQTCCEVFFLEHAPLRIRLYRKIVGVPPFGTPDLTGPIMILSAVPMAIAILPFVFLHVVELRARLVIFIGWIASLLVGNALAYRIPHLDYRIDLRPLGL